MYDEVIHLISVEKSVNAIGDVVENRTETQRFCSVKSVGETEFYQAQASGFKPSVKFILADFLDYQGQPYVRWVNPWGVEEELTIIRTYKNERSELELTCQKGIE